MDFDQVAICIDDGQEVPAGVAQPSQLVKRGQLGGLHRVTSGWGPAGTGSGAPAPAGVMMNRRRNRSTRLKRQTGVRGAGLAIDVQAEHLGIGGQIIGFGQIEDPQSAM
ncbi:hypothetical protein [Amycolatopsis sp. lyj-109]|uniref:hypothetical protein n=1 Tax=Amycolatopsis sp. lyj-109 TaxID=2789287 RepID=UPI00397813AC